MKVIKLTLSGYTRTMLSGHKKIEYTPEAPMQVILGTNGSGKSSLVHELFPLPSNGAFYEKDGFKELEFTHNGDHYVQRSSFETTTGKHSLVKNGEIELNKSLGPKGLLEVVEREFYITPQKRDLLTGKMRFSSMSINDRRTLLTEMSDVDYTYALSVYKRAKDYARDIKGALTLAKKRLVMEQSKILGKEEIETLTRQTNALHKQISELLEERAPISKDSETAKSELRTYLNKLQSDISDLEAINTEPPSGYSYDGLESIVEAMDAFKRDIGVSANMVTHLTEEYSKIEKEVRLLESTGGKDIGELVEQKKEGEQAIEQLRVTLQTKAAKEITNYANASMVFRSVQDSLLGVFNDLPDNETLLYSNATIKLIEPLIEELKADRHELDMDLRRLASEKDHLDFHKTKGPTTCPRCQHGWVIGFSQERYDQVSQEIDKLSARRKEVEVSIDKNTELLSATLKFISTYRSYLVIKGSNEVLSPLWLELDEQGISFKKPSIAIRIVEKFASDMAIVDQIVSIQSQLANIEGLISVVRAGDAKDLAQSKAKLEAIERDIVRYTQEGSKATSILEEHRRYYHNVTRFLEGAQRATPALVDTILNASKQTAEVMIQEHIHAVVRSLQSELAIKEDILSQVNVQQAMICDLEEQIADLSAKEKAAKVIVRELGPTEGLVAEGMMGFINMFIGQINAVVSRVWTYPLEILPCSVEGDENPELTYRFELITGEDAQKRDDIKDGSTGMCDIVDLGFRIAAAKRLKLESFPLFLDEFGSGFDPSHQKTASAVTASILEQGLFEQIFMISHHESSYGALSSAQFLVLDDTNIKPSHVKYNDHVVFS